MPVDADAYTLAAAMSEPDYKGFDIVSSQLQYVPDLNNGSYVSGQLNLSTSNLTRSNDAFWDPRSSFLVIPMVMEANLTNAVTTTAVENALWGGIRSSLSLIHSISARINGAEVVSAQPFLNAYLQFKCTSEFSESDVRTMGPTILWSPDCNADGAQHLGWSAARGAYNTTIQNTAYVTTNPFSAPAFNESRRIKLRTSNMAPTDTVPAQFTSSTLLANQLRSYVATITASRLTNYITAVIPMRLLHPMFAELPLMKGSVMDLLINVNTSTVTMPTTAATPAVESAITVVSQNGTSPISLTPFGAAGTGFIVDGAAGVGSIVVDLRIAKSAAGNAHPLTASRLYCRMVKLSPKSQSAYLTHPKRTVVYRDIVTQQLLNQATNTSINQLLWNALPRIRRLIIIPQLASGSNGTWNVTQAQSPFVTSVGDGPCPMACSAYSNLQVLVSGQAVYTQNLQYSWEMFLQEIRGSGMVDGGLDMAINGLISQETWNNGWHGYGIVDLSHHDKATDDKSASIEIRMTQAHPKTINYLFIAEIEKEFDIHVEQGGVVV